MFSRLLISQQLDWHHSFELVVPTDQLEGEGKTFIMESHKLLGKTASIQFEETVQGGGNGQSGKKQIFKGVVTGVSLSKQSTVQSELIVSGLAPTAALDALPHTRSFQKKTLQQIVDEVIKPQKSRFSSLKISPQFKTAIPYITQYKESNFIFLSRLAARYGEWFFYDGEQLFFGKSSDGKSIPLTLGKDLDNFNLGLKMAPHKFKLLHQDYMMDQLFESSSSSSQVKGLDAFGQTSMDASDKLFSEDVVGVASPPISQKSDLDAYAGIYKGTHATDLVVVRGTTDNAALKLGKEIQLKGLKGEQAEMEDYGSFVVVGLTHSMNSGGGYVCQFEAIPARLNIPPPNQRARLPFCEFQSAVVRDNNDPDKMGRVRVQFRWQKDPEISALDQSRNALCR